MKYQIFQTLNSKKQSHDKLFSLKKIKSYFEEEFVLLKADLEFDIA
jgi:hypothetical protein